VQQLVPVAQQQTPQATPVRQSEPVQQLVPVAQQQTPQATPVRQSEPVQQLVPVPQQQTPQATPVRQSEPVQQLVPVPQQQIPQATPVRQQAIRDALTTQHRGIADVKATAPTIAAEQPVKNSDATAYRAAIVNQQQPVMTEALQVSRDALASQNQGTTDVKAVEPTVNAEQPVKNSDATAYRNEVNATVSNRTVAQPVVDSTGQAISANAGSIDTNRQRIAVNGQSIQYNAARIDTNGQAISANRQSIQRNSARLDSAEKSIKRNSDRIDDNSKKIKQIGNNAAAMSSLHFNANRDSWALSTGTGNGEGAGFAAGIQKGVTEHTAVTFQASTDSQGGWMAGAGLHGDF
ncbi:hypothetical protein ACOZB2_28205, partial [Pantoea endophytica]